MKAKNPASRRRKAAVVAQAHLLWHTIESLEKRVYLDGPRVTAAEFIFDELQTLPVIEFTFDADVSESVDAGDLELFNLNEDDFDPTGKVSVDTSLSGNRVRFGFSGFPNGLPPSGNYQARLVPDGITDEQQRPLVPGPETELDFFYLRADFNRDRSVNLADFNIMAPNFGQSSRLFSEGDANHDGSVNLSDFNALTAGFGSQLHDPSDMSANTVAADRIHVFWPLPTEQVSYYELWRSDNYSPYVKIAKLPSERQTFADVGLHEGTRYRYRLRVKLDAGGWGGWLAAGATTVLPAPSNLVVSETGPASVTLTWDDNAVREDGYRIYYSLDGGAWQEAGTTERNVTSFEYEEISPASAYLFRVEAFNLATPSSPTLATPITPKSPMNLRARNVSLTRNTLMWEDRSDQESSYRIYRSIGGSAFVEIGAVGPDKTAFDDFNAAPGAIYFVRARTVGSGRADSKQAYATGLSTLYRNDFETDLAGTSPVGVQGTWTVGFPGDDPLISTAAADRDFLGPFDPGDVLRLQLVGAALPQSGTLQLSFDFFAIGDWQGYGEESVNPSIFQISRFSGSTLIFYSTSFSNDPQYEQAFPDEMGDLNFYPAHTAAVEVNSLGYSESDSVYRVTVPVNITSGVPEFRFDSSYAGKEEAKWGIDNVVISRSANYTISGANQVDENADPPYVLQLSRGEFDPQPTSWRIDWGDGTVQTVLASGLATHVAHFFPDGTRTYEISAWADGPDGLQDVITNKFVQVDNTAPQGIHVFPAEAPNDATFTIPLATFEDRGFGTERFWAEIDWGVDGTNDDVTEGILDIVPGGPGRATRITVSGRFKYTDNEPSHTATVRLYDRSGELADEEVEIARADPPVYTLSGTPTESRRVKFTLTNKPFNAAYNNELGWFVVEDEEGTIDYASESYSPGDPDYIPVVIGAALDSEYEFAGIAFPQFSPVGTTVDVILEVGQTLSFFLVQNSHAAEVIDEDHFVPNVFFPHVAANFDGYAHFRKVVVDGDRVDYFVEDLSFGGDEDFDDMVFSVEASDLGTHTPVITGNPPTGHSPALVGAPPATITLRGTIRDLHPSTPQEPNDFEVDHTLGIVENLVRRQIGPDRKPRLVSPHPVGHGHIENEDSFSQWFNDIPGVNLSSRIAIEFEHHTDGMYRFTSPATGFFPINNQLFGNENGDKNGNFTIEFHSAFTYREDAENPMVFIFEGDDDVWVYINDQLVIDLGGIHPRNVVDPDDPDSGYPNVPGVVELNPTKAAQLGLVDGQSYPFDFFFAERFSSGSHFSATTNLPLGYENVYRAQLTATDEDPDDYLTWTVLEPANAIIRPVSGASPLTSELLWIPTHGDYEDPVTFTVIVTDLDGNSSQQFTWMVDVSGFTDNDPPQKIFNAPDPPSEASVGRRYEWDASSTFFDPNSDLLYFDRIDLPDWMTLDENGFFSGTPESHHIDDSPYTVSYQVTDRRGDPLSDTFQIVVDFFPPAPPTGVAISTTQQANPLATIYHVSWLKSPDSDVSGYNLYRAERRPDGVLLETEKLNEALIPPAEGRVLQWTHSAIDAPEKGIRYHYWAEAVSIIHIPSPPSQVAEWFEKDSDDPSPGPALDTPVILDNGVLISWTDSSERDLEWVEMYAGDVSTFDPSSSTLLARLREHETLEYLDDSAPARGRNGEVRHYKARYVDQSGNGSAFTTAYIPLPNTIPPWGVDRFSLREVEYESALHIKITWDGRFEHDVAGFELERKIGTGGWDLINEEFTSEDRAYFDPVSVPSDVDVLREYRIITYDNNDDPDPNRSLPTSASITPTGMVDNTPPSAPQDVVATALSGTLVQVKWDYSSFPDDFDTFIVERSFGDDPENFTPISPDDQGIRTTIWYDNAVYPGAYYFYRVVARDTSDNASSTAIEQPVHTPLSNDSTLRPENLIVAYAGLGRVNLQWDPMPGLPLLGFDVYRSTLSPFEPTPHTLIGSTINEQYVDDDTSISQTYYYRVMAVSEEGDSTPSLIESVELLPQNVTALVAPGDVSLTAVSQGQVDVRWRDASTSELGFRIFRREDEMSSWMIVGNVTTNSTSLTDFPDVQGSSLQYKVAAYNDNGQEVLADSAIVTITFSSNGEVDPPGNLHAVTVTAREVALQWDRVDEAVGYNVYRQKGNGPFVRVNREGLVSEMQFTDRRLTPATTYSYRVTAVAGPALFSLPSNTTAQTLPSPGEIPFVAFTRHPGGSSFDITRDTAIWGIVDDPDNDPLTYQVLLRPTASHATDLVVYEGTGEVGVEETETDGILAFLRPTILPEGRYTLVLKASDDENNIEVVGAEVHLKSELKLGNFTLPVVDLTIDVPGGEPITISRIYDSARATQKGAFGNGWRFDSFDLDLRTTAQPRPGDGGIPSFRLGDVVYVTLPGNRRQAFAFRPDPFGSPIVGTQYKPKFIAVDGSGSRLGLPEGLDNQIIMNSPDGKEFTIVAINGQDLPGSFGYNPARAQLGRKYELTTAEGVTYTFGASTGSLERIVDASGYSTLFNSVGAAERFDPLWGDPPTMLGASVGASRITSVDGLITFARDRQDGTNIGVRFVYDPETEDLIGVIDRAEVDGQKVKTTYVYADRLVVPYTSARNQKVYAIITDEDNKVWRDGEFQQPSNDRADDAVPLVGITYDGSLEQKFEWHVGDVPRREDIPLDIELTVTYYVTALNSTDPDPQDVQTWQETKQWNDPGPHLLTAVIDPRGVKTISATYHPETRELIELTDATQQIAPIQNGGFNGREAKQTITDLAENETELVYNQRGDVIREIRELKDFEDNIIGWMVTVRDFLYGGPTAESNGVSLYNVLFMSREGQPFLVPHNDPLRRYTDRPAVWARTVTHDIHAGSGNHRFRYPESEEVPSPTNPDELLRTEYHDYTPLGQPTRIINPYGGETKHTYNSDGQLTRSENPAGDATQYSYHPNHKRLLDVRRETGETSIVYLTSNLYWANTTATSLVPGHLFGYPQETTDNVTGLRTRYAYWPTGQVASVFREFGGMIVRDTATRYDYAGRVVEVLEGGTISTNIYEIDWDDPTAARTITQYDLLGRVTKTIDRFGGSTTYTYDIRGQRIETAYPDGTATRTVYDEMGRAIWTSERTFFNEPYPTEPLFIASQTTYDAAGRVIATERFENAEIDLVEDQQGLYKTVAPTAGIISLSTTSTIYDAHGRVAETVNADGLRTGTIYYLNGQVYFTGTLKNNAPADWHKFDSWNDPQDYFEEADLKKEQHFAKDAGETHLLITSYAYDLTNSLPNDIEAVRYDTVTDARGLTTYTYKDVLGRVIRTTWDNGTPEDNEDDVSTETWYSVRSLPIPDHDLPGDQILAGQQIVQIDQEGIATDYFYDHAGRLTDVWQPEVADAENGGTLTRPRWQYQHDHNGNQTLQHDPRHNETRFKYDVFNRRIERTLPEVDSQAVTEHWAYDHFGRVLTHTDFEGRATQYVYSDDPSLGLPVKERVLGRLVEERRFDGAVGPTPDEKTVYGYDAWGRRSEVEEYVDTTPVRGTGYAYDPISGSVAEVDSPEGIIAYEYDPATGRLERTYTEDNDTSYAYDLHGRLEQVTATKLNGDAVNLVTRYTYDAVGNLAAVEQPNGVLSLYHYDMLNRLENLTVTNGDEFKLFEQDYALRSNGQRDYVVEKRYDGNGNGTSNVVSNVKIEWSYDALNRLTSETRDSDPTPGNGSDDFGEQEGSDYTTTYGFDRSGNRMSKVHDAVGTADDSATVYEYNERDQLMLEQTDLETTTFVSADESVEHAYDDNGSLTSKEYYDDEQTLTRTDAFNWDLRNRMSSASVDGTTTTYAYDHDGVRVSQTTSGATTTYLNDKNNPTGYAKSIEDRVDDDLERSYVLGHKVEIQGDLTNGTLYLLTDGHGSTRALVNAGGGVIEQYDYEAFGGAIGFNAAAAKTSWLFGGDGVYDAKTGWTYHLARWRDGFRFVSYDSFEADPASPADLHKYTYALANPLNYSDPSGYWSIAGILARVGMIMGLLAGGFLAYTNFALLRGILESPNATVGEGGAEISANALLSIRAQIIGAYLSAPLSQQKALRSEGTARNYISSGNKNWDIVQLFESGFFSDANPHNDRKREDVFRTSTSTLGGTVTIAGRVYESDEVNYWLYGAMTRAMDEAFGTSSRRIGSAKVIGHRVIAEQGEGTKPRGKWFMAGYYGDFSYVDGTELPNARPSSTLYIGQLTAYWGTAHPTMIWAHSWAN